MPHADGVGKKGEDNLNIFLSELMCKLIATLSDHRPFQCN
jgi:hypothetical protein